ncbi:SCP-like protein [Oesophagostomum dentatum]|uniref:SCP-like protein n=1 Tax=Oesophagostomum dentatum TaxID=61180 RepID=A0A0B1S5W5_OESDE|nr:SCP-like protein [Oesophagostomum dentatum]
MNTLGTCPFIRRTSLGICPDRYGMNDDARQKIWEIHNQLRSLVAKGEAKDKLGGYAPTAARMYRLEYDCEMEKLAGIHAKKCQIKQSERSAKKEVGENIYVSRARGDKRKLAEEVTNPHFYRNTKTIITALQAARNWFSELANYGVGKENVLSKELTERPGTKIEHYTQMVWQTTTSLGCAIQNCKKMTLFVCNYRDA